jgi:sulfite reductase (NADPH) flavoprotein alpha-component
MTTSDETIIGQQRPVATLIVQQGSHAGKSFPVSKEAVTIGRVDSTDVILQDPEVSRQHALISWKVLEFVIEDLASSNGTFVNGERITSPHMLKPGDSIRVGQTILRFKVERVGLDGLLAPQSAPAGPKSSPRNQNTVPSRLILTTAAQTNKRLGHENLGFLSESHGIMPLKSPPLKLPPGYEAWDDLAESLPELYRTLSVRKALAALPVLSAKEEDLPDECLLRASVIMSMLAHAYYRVEADPPQTPLPEGIQRPWAEIARRLQRPVPHLAYIDLIMYNWRLIDPNRRDPMRVDNLRLLVPTVDNQEERIFYLTQVEILAQCTPVISALVHAQEAVQRDDMDALKQELILIAASLQHVTHESFMNINPNPHSDTYVDPVVWAKTVAPFAVPIQPGTAGPSGTSAPIFHMLDMFFGRHRYDTRFGQEMLHLRDWYPKHWQDFIEALGEVSVADYVERCGAPILKGMYKEAAQAYAGESGFLSRHRLKVYGYLDIGFKVGRNVTITGFTGLFKDRTWDEVDFELADAHQERQKGFPPSSHYARIKSVNRVNLAGDPARWVKRIVLDVSETGLHYRPGDRCAVLPENSDDLVDKTLLALKARGYETVTLTAEWREALALRDGYEGATTLPLRTLLKLGRIRPVDRSVAKALYGASLNSDLRHIIEARAEDQWELWDLLEMLAKAGFDPKELWKAHPGQRRHICRIVPPELFRMYSIASHMGADPVNGASELHLTIGRLLYETGDTEVTVKAQRHGTTSHFLGQSNPTAPEEQAKVSLRLVHPPRFSLPKDPHTPIVMFAGGTGLAPFRGFIRERAEQDNGGANWLFFGTRTREEFYYREELEPVVARGRLHLRPAFSRDAVEARFVANGNGEGHFVFEPGQKQHIADEIQREENARALWDLLGSRKDGGQGAYLYVCGRTGFANSVMAGLKGVIRRYADGPEEEKEEKVKQVLYRLVGEERYMQDIFTTYTGAHIDKDQAFYASEIVLHNDAANGYWMVINGRVYDLTEFAHLHPGGVKIINGYAGMDATIAYQKVLHHVNPEVDSMLGMYELGIVRRLDFGMEWGVAVGPDGLRFISLADVYRAWIRFLYNVVEMENALRNDFSLRHQALTRDETPATLSPLKLQFLLEVHDRFILNYLEGSMGKVLENLWAATSGICAHNQDVRWMHETVTRIRQSQEANTVQRLSQELARSIKEIVEHNATEEHPTVKLAQAYCALLEEADERFLSELKMALRAGVMVFEEWERDTVKQSRDRLLETVRQIPRILESYYARVLSRALLVFLDRPNNG